MIDPLSLLAANGGQIGNALVNGVPNFDAVLQGYVDTGYANALAVGIAAVDADGIAEAWAYGSFYQGLVESMAMMPSSSTLADAGSMSWTSAQLKVFADRAAYWFALYATRLETATTVVVVDDTPWLRVRSLRYVG